ncbi:MAG: hypothetical protein KIG60_06450 [Caryophanon sp.]|nr:hypothetical protein [Caryophanon sp.]
MFPYIGVLLIATIAISSLIFDVPKVGAIGVAFLALIASALHSQIPVFIFGYVITLSIVATVGIQGEGTLVVSYTNVYLLHLLSSITLFSLTRFTNQVHCEANHLMINASEQADKDTMQRLKLEQVVQSITNNLQKITSLNEESSRAQLHMTEAASDVTSGAKEQQQQILSVVDMTNATKKSVENMMETLQHVVEQASSAAEEATTGAKSMERFSEAIHTLIMNQQQNSDAVQETYAETKKLCNPKKLYACCLLICNNNDEKTHTLCMDIEQIGFKEDE